MEGYSVRLFSDLTHHQIFNALKRVLNLTKDFLGGSILSEFSGVCLQTKERSVGW
jgi:hypothetical protein